MSNEILYSGFYSLNSRVHPQQMRKSALLDSDSVEIPNTGSSGKYGHQSPRKKSLECTNILHLWKKKVSLRLKTL